MDWLVDRVFPFRRLTVWLGLLVLVVSALALTFSYLLVIASLEDSLVSNRVSITARAAETSAPTFATNFANALSVHMTSPRMKPVNPGTFLGKAIRLALAVMSSPMRPLPRVIAWTNWPLSNRKEIDAPSILSMTRYGPWT